MKKGYRIILSLAALAIAFQILVGSFLEKDTPEELEHILNSSRQNEKLVKTIGGYRSYELSYNYKLRDAQSNYAFDVTVFGEEAYIDFKGVSKYNHEENTWSIIKLDTLFKKY